MTVDFSLSANPRRAPGSPYEPLRRFVSKELASEASLAIRAWEGYAPTPLLRWPGLARMAGVSLIFCKYEGTRFEIGSFKALGGAYAAMRAAKQHAAAKGLPIGSATLATASDGNHGLSVAWGAQRIGARAVVFLHANVSQGRQALIERMGAEIIRVAGNYDDSTSTAARVAAERGWVLVPDTSAAYDETPVRVMAGYGVIAEELADQIAEDETPTHIFLQGGCGGFAASLCGLFREADDTAAAPRIVIVEPDRAACLFASNRAGHAVMVSGDLDTVMTGLSVGEVSGVAWPVLRQGADAFMTITDRTAIAAMQIFASGRYDPPVQIGDSGVAGIAGFLALSGDAAARAALGIDEASRILVVATEGAVDAESYARLIAEPVPFTFDGWPAPGSRAP